MKIRGLLAGLLLAVVVTGCTGSPTTYEAPPPAPAFDNAPPPPDTTTNRSGGTMGTGT